MNQESKRPITVEDLLRLKRAERPPVEFWDQFDRELRAKQLAALVEKRPWWRSLPQTFGRLSRFSLPLGATAVLAMTYVATRDYQSDAMPSVPAESPVAVETSPGPTAIAAVSPQAVPVSLPAAEEIRSAQLEALAPRVPAAAADVFAAESSVEMDGSRIEPRISEEEISPSARHIAANLAVAQATTPVSHSLVSAPHAFEVRATPARTIEPLAQVSTPAERSRARFATAMVASFNGDTRGRASSANVARRISDERVYDDVAIRRVGATGNSVAWRF